MLPVTQREWAKPWELLCMHVVGKSNRGAACCLASGPSRQKETKLKFILCCGSFLLFLISLPRCCFCLLASDRLLGTDSVQSLGGSSASLFHLRSKYGPSPPAVLSHYFGIKDSLFCKRKTGLGGAFFYALSDREFV